MRNASRTPSRRGRVLGLALAACLALSALTAASASALSTIAMAGHSFQLQQGAYVLEMPNAGTFECQASNNADVGMMSSSTEMEVKFTFQGCHAGSVKCTTKGQEKGTIVTSALLGKLIYLDAKHTKFGMLFTPPASGVFAEFSCSWLLNMVVRGGGWIGQITKPKLNESSEKFRLTFGQTAAGHQQYQQVEEAGVHYHLEDSLNSGTFAEMALTGESIGTLAAGEGTFIP